MREINGNTLVGILGENKGQVHFRGIIHFANFLECKLSHFGVQFEELKLKVVRLALLYIERYKLH